MVSNIKVFCIGEDFYLGDGDVPLYTECVCSHSNNGYANASQSYVIRALPVLLVVLFREGCWERVFHPVVVRRRSPLSPSHVEIFLGVWVKWADRRWNGVPVRNICVTGNYDVAPVFVNHHRGKNYPLRHPWSGVAGAPVIFLSNRYVHNFYFCTVQ